MYKREESSIISKNRLHEIFTKNLRD